MYLWLLAVLLLLPCFHCNPMSGRVILKESIVPRQASPSDIFRIAFHGSFVLGNKLYIDGGDATLSGSQQVIFNQSTIVVDLSSSFLTDKLSGGTSPKGQFITKGDAPTFDGTGYWVDEATQTAYAFGGGVSVLRPWTGISSVPLEELWTISANQSWRKVDQTLNAGFNNLTRPFGGAYTHGKVGGFWLGGYYSRYTSQKTNTVDNTPNSGLVYFNYTDKSWSNISTAGLYDGTFVGSPGGMQYVPSYGKSGVLVVFGGQTIRPQPWIGVSYHSSNISVFDLASRTWHYQTATGDMPKNAMRFCNVGASSTSGPNGTYEIFMYGGIMEDTSNVVGDDIYILSLPAFHWHKLNVTSGDPRAFHTCNVAGKRHMFSVGGLDPTVARLGDLSLRTQDPYTYGIKVFDMTALNWTNSFNPSATYDTPQPIKDFYNTNPRYPALWNSAGLQDIFIAPIHPQQLSTSTIVGGVLGAVAFIAILGFVVWRIQTFRRAAAREADVQARFEAICAAEKANNQSPTHSDLEIDNRASIHRCGKFELGPGNFADAGKQELPGTMPVHELDGLVRPHTAVAQMPRYELDHGSRRPAASVSPSGLTDSSAGSETTYVSFDTRGYRTGDGAHARITGGYVSTKEIEFKGGWI